MNDRELLEAAARAEGRTLKYMTQHIEGREPETFIACWNPLTDDGDAFRLAAKLKIPVCFDFEVPVNDDPMTTTRRAIVRAAAEIGRKAA